MERILINKYKEILDLFGVNTIKGFSPAELEAIGPMPAALLYFYMNYGKIEALQDLQDCLILPNRYQEYMQEDYLIFFDENQGVCQAGVKKSERTAFDPPVYVRMDGGEWNLSSTCVSDFLVAMFGYQASMCLPYSKEEYDVITEVEQAYIEKAFKKREGQTFQWLGLEISLYGDNIQGRLAIMSGWSGIQMIYAANTEQEFRRMSLLIKGMGDSDEHTGSDEEFCKDEMYDSIFQSFAPLYGDIIANKIAKLTVEINLYNQMGVTESNFQRYTELIGEYQAYMAEVIG